VYIGLLVDIPTSRGFFPNCAAAKYYAVTAIKTILTHVLISKSTELLGWDGGRKSEIDKEDQMCSASLYILEFLSNIEQYIAVYAVHYCSSAVSPREGHARM
jgi:hypothetical protein